MKQKKIFIHIGVGKTGTTAIQDSMLLHREELAGQGVLYPLTGLNESAHHDLVELWKDAFAPDDVARYSQLLSEFDASGKSVMFLSSEKFCFASGGFVEGVFQAFEGFDVKIIIYVRTQVQQIESTFLQWLRVGHPYGDGFESFFETHLDSFNYSRIVSPWAYYFGKDAIVARCYDHPGLRSDAFSGIKDILGVRVSSQKPHASNQSLIPELSKLLCAIDKASVEPFLRAEIIDVALNVSAKFKRHSSDRLMDAERIQRVKEYYLKPNLEFARQFLSEEDAAFFLSKA